LYTRGRECDVIRPAFIHLAVQKLCSPIELGVADDVMMLIAKERVELTAERTVYGILSHIGVNGCVVHHATVVHMNLLQCECEILVS
jgi:hypothetical protein